MASFELPPSLTLTPDASAKLQGEIIVVFLGGPLCEHTYRPLGINALWTLIGAIASLEKPFSFWIKSSMTGNGPIGGFLDGRFCIFEIGDRSGRLVAFTARNIQCEGAAKITINDQVFGMFYCIPESAMMPFDDLVRVGNSLLLCQGTFVRTEVAQRYKNWIGDKYAGD